MTAPRVLIAGNWKMFKTTKEVTDFFRDFIPAAKLSAGVDVLFAVPYTLLSVARAAAEKSGIRIAAQNVHFEASGAYTGEISIPMLKDIGITATLIGHSERRQYFAETDASVNKKLLACLQHRILPIVCVGETRAERESGRTTEVVTKQLEAALVGVDDPKDLVIAYEPVWAIGTGLTATNAQAQEVHALIRRLLIKKFGATKAQAMRVLYGGSVKSDNISGLLAEPDINGGLVGGASLKPDEFAKIVNSN